MWRIYKHKITWLCAVYVKHENLIKYCVCFSTSECFHLDVEFFCNRSESLQVKLLLTGFLGVHVQRVDQSFASATLTHA